MADAAARREARRKRILENSHNRLQFISGKSGDDCPRVSPIRSIIPDQEREIPVLSASSGHRSICLDNGLIVSEPETFEFLLPDNDIVAAGDGESSNDLASFVEPVPFPSRPNHASPVSLVTTASEPVQTSLLEKLVTYKYDIVLLALFIQLLDSLSVVTTENSYFFVPVIIYTITKFVWFPVASNSGLASVLLLLNSPSSARIHKMLEVAQYASVIGRDICVFLFTSICIQSLFIVLKDSFVT